MRIVKSLIALVLLLISYSLTADANLRCKDVPSSYSLDEKETENIKILRDVFADLPLSDNLFGLIKIYVRYATKPNIKENSYNLEDEFNFSFNKKIDEP